MSARCIVGSARARCAALVLSVCYSGILGAQGTAPPVPDSATTVQAITITGDQPVTTPVQQLTLPVAASITARRIEETINLVDPEDAVKYLPSVFLRKRNYGDTQAAMGTRVWGVSSSARSLIFADGVPLTALIANNNTIGSPRWGLVAPVEIKRIDMMYGPFSAAYSGNSMGAVMEITTRMPEKLEGSINQTQALQRFDLYGTKNSYGTSQTTANLGDRFGRLSFWASGNYQHSNSQPLSYVTSTTQPSGTTGAFPDQNKLGAAINVLGAGGLLHTGMTNAKLKVAYDFTPVLRGAYTFGYWKNDADATVDTYIQNAGHPVFASQSGFGSGFYHVVEEHQSHSVLLRSDTKRDWDVEGVAAIYTFQTDRQNTPTSVSAGDTTFGSAGRIASLDGTGWYTLDLKGLWHRGGPSAVHSVSFGVHHDRYELYNPTYNTPNWRGDSLGGIATEGDGKTRTEALWVQDRWLVAPTVTLTVGGRYENWRAFDGYNVNGATKVSQPSVSATRFSPKAIVAWDAAPQWVVTASVGKAYRFPTTSELYQLVSTGATFTSPAPNLKPDNVLSSELRVERAFSRGRAQLAFFQQDVHDAIISQFLPLVAGSPTVYSYLSNVDHVRARGVELVLGSSGVLLPGLEFTGSATYLNATTLALSGQPSANAPADSAVGKFLPNIPKWRANFTGTYHASQRLSLTVAGRYSSEIYTTLDNADVHPNTYQGFAGWFVANAHANYRFQDHWSLSLGADNLLNRRYFLFHPFPQRTFVGSLQFAF